MGDEGRRLSWGAVTKARVGWALVVTLFCFAYLFFALTFIFIRLWLWASAVTWELALKWREALLGTSGERFLPRLLREPGAEERLGDLIARNRQVLDNYGWLP